MIFYSSLHGAERGKFKPLIEEYAIFENLDLSELVNPYNHVPLFDKSAYGSQEVGQYFNKYN